MYILEKTSYLDTFHAVNGFDNLFLVIPFQISDIYSTGWSLLKSNK